MTLFRKTLPSLLAVAMVAGSSFAFAADNKPGDKSGDATPRDEQTTGSINKEGRTPTPEEREYCMTAPAGDSTCESLGLTPTR